MLDINPKNSTSQKSQKGTSLFFAVLIMSILLGVGLGISTLLIRQMRMMKGLGDSVVAFYAADTGIEKALYDFKNQGWTLPPPCSTNPYCSGSIGGATYFVRGYSAGDPKCPLPNQYFCIKSIGTYKGTRRAIEASY